MRARVGFLLLLVPLLAAAEGRAPQPHSYMTSVEPDEVELGRPFELRIEIRHPPKESYRLPADLALGPAVVGKVQAVRGEGETTFVLEARIFDALGEVQLPEVLVEAFDAEGALEPLRVPGAAIRIRETGAGTELEPPPAPIPVEVFAWERLLVAACALAVVLAFAILLRRRRARRAEAERPLDPAARAAEAIRALREESPWEKGEVRRHYFRLSEIFRVYLRDACGIAAVEMTSEELLVALGRRPVPGLSRARVEAWILRGDVVRFAKGEADAAQALADLDELEAMVRDMEEARAPQAAGGAP